MMKPHFNRDLVGIEIVANAKTMRLEMAGSSIRKTVAGRVFYGDVYHEQSVAASQTSRIALPENACEKC
jgi:hypothetical protein